MTKIKTNMSEQDMEALDKALKTLSVIAKSTEDAMAGFSFSTGISIPLTAAYTVSTESPFVDYEEKTPAHYTEIRDKQVFERQTAILELVLKLRFSQVLDYLKDAEGFGFIDPFKQWRDIFWSHCGDINVSPFEFSKLIQKILLEDNEYLLSRFFDRFAFEQVIRSGLFSNNFTITDNIEDYEENYKRTYLSVPSREWDLRLIRGVTSP